MNRWYARLWGFVSMIMFGLSFCVAAFAQTTPNLELVVICGTATPPGTTPISTRGAIPEPATFGMLLAGLLAVVLLRKRLKRHHFSLLLIAGLCGGSAFLLGQGFPSENFFLIKPGSGGGIVTIDGKIISDPTVLKQGLEFVAGQTYYLRARPEPDATFSGWELNNMPAISPAYVAPGDRVAAVFSEIPERERALFVQLFPNDLFAGEAEEVTISVDFSSYRNEGMTHATWQIADIDGQPLSPVRHLVDDGQVERGDETANDSFFSDATMLSFPQKQHVYVTVRAYAGTRELVSQTTTLPVYNHITEAEWNSFLQTIDEMKSEYRHLKEQSGRETAVAQVVAWLRKKPEVVEAGNEFPDGGIWILQNPGLIGGLHVLQRGLKINNPQLPQDHAAQCTSLPDPNSESCKKFCNIDTPKALLPQHDPTSHRIGNNKVFLASPAFGAEGMADLPGSTETSDIIPILQGYGSDFEIPPVLVHNQASIEQFKTLSQYGTILIASHGTIFKDKKYALMSGEPVTPNKKEFRYERDLHSKRLLVATIEEMGESFANYFWIRPSFIEHYAKKHKYSNSLVFFSTCVSARENSMAQAFLDMGAKTYLGFTNYVGDKFCHDVSVEFFTNFLKNSNTTTGDAFSPSYQIDCIWSRMVGSDALMPPIFVPYAQMVQVSSADAVLYHAGWTLSEQTQQLQWKMFAESRPLPLNTPLTLSITTNTSMKEMRIEAAGQTYQLAAAPNSSNTIWETTLSLPQDLMATDFPLTIHGKDTNDTPLLPFADTAPKAYPPTDSTPSDAGDTAHRLVVLPPIYTWSIAAPGAFDCAEADGGVACAFGTPKPSGSAAHYGRVSLLPVTAENGSQYVSLRSSSSGVYVMPSDGLRLDIQPNASWFGDCDPEEIEARSPGSEDCLSCQEPNGICPEICKMPPETTEDKSLPWRLTVSPSGEDACELAVIWETPAGTQTVTATLQPRQLCEQLAEQSGRSGVHAAQVTCGWEEIEKTDWYEAKPTQRTHTSTGPIRSDKYLCTGDTRYGWGGMAWNNTCRENPFWKQCPPKETFPPFLPTEYGFQNPQLREHTVTNCRDWEEERWKWSCNAEIFSVCVSAVVYYACVPGSSCQPDVFSYGVGDTTETYQDWIIIANSRYRKQASSALALDGASLQISVPLSLPHHP